MKTLVRFTLALIAIVTLFSCSKKLTDYYQLTAQFPSGVVRSDTVIVVTFSGGVVNADSTNVWTGTPFIDFTPPIPGKFIWQDTSVLVFSPDVPLSGDTKFQGRLNTALIEKYSGVKHFRGDETFTFATDRFRMARAEFFYDRLADKRTVGIKANLEFTYAVNPADVVKYLTVTIDNEKRQGFTTAETRTSRVIPVEIGAVQQAENPKTIAVLFDPALTSTETNTRIATDIPFTFNLPGIGELAIYGHSFGSDGNEGWISIRTSQEVDTASVRSFIKLQPDLPYTFTCDRQNLTIRGTFKPGTQIHMALAQGLESILGAKLKNDYEADILIGNIAPSFSFLSANGTYMMLGGQRTLDIKSVNCSHLMVRVSEIFQNNLIFFLENGRYYDYDYEYRDDDEEGGGSYTRKFRYNIGNFGRSLWYDSIPVNNVQNREVITHFDLKPHLSNTYKGFYVVEIASTSQPWRSTAKLVSISDLGLIVKKSSDQVTVFVTNLQTTQPVAEATVNLISTSNQTIVSEKSDADGKVVFNNYRQTAGDFDLRVVTAESGNDFNFINLPDYRVETSRFDVGGKYESENLYDAFVYGDRTLYRPGETIVLSGIVRNLTNPLPAGMPVKWKLFNPRGTMIREAQQTLNDQGSFEAKYETGMAAITGDYHFEFSTGNDLYLASYGVSVEEFVPDRMRVGLTPSRDHVKPGETLNYDLQATNFFGPPAANRNYEFEGTFLTVPYISKKYPGFWFSDEGASNYTGSPTLVTGKTNEKGKASISFSMPANLTTTGILKARGRVAVFDESGRPVYQVTQTTVFTKPYFVGLHSTGDYYVAPNTQQHIQIAAVDTSDRPINGFRAKVDIIRFEWHSVLREHPSTHTLRYVSEKRELVEKSETVTLGQDAMDYVYTVLHSGEYVIRVSREGDSGYNQRQFYSYSWGSSDVTSFETNPEAHVDMVFNDSVYHPGDKAKILFKTPFSGRMLVTVERNKVYKSEFLDVVNNAASIEIPVEDQYLPNVYVTATLFRKITDAGIPLLVGHGFAPLKVEKKSNLIAVSISAPEKMRPKTKQEITIKAGSEENIFVTLAAVDEGILQLRNMRTPDPFGYFYAKKALQTESYDFFRNLLPEPAKSSPGGGEGDLSKRVNPLGVKRFKPLAIWSGIQRTNSSGEVKVTLDVPEFNGELRLMAIAYKGDRFGSAQRAMKVTDPVVITPALPRFLSPGDSITMPITAFNTTNKPVSLTLEISTEGGVASAAHNAKLDIVANEEKFVTVGLKATNEVGKAVVKVRTSAFGETIEATTELPVRPTAPYATDVSAGLVTGAQPVTLDVPDVYLPWKRTSYLTISPFPVVNFSKELRYLVGYPHGCIEQTVSKAFPQIYLRDIAILLDPSILNNGSPAYFVNEAITKIVSMQMGDGQFTYWPGGNETNIWGTVYATHFLLEAKKAGYAVPEGCIRKAATAVSQIARSKRTQDYYYYDQQKQKVLVRRIADKTTIYALYVLAIAGSPETSLMNFYRTDRSLLTTDTQYLLAGAFALSGDRRTYLELMPKQFETEQAQRECGGNFDSPVRSNAIILNVLLETDPDNPAVPHYMDYLSREYRGDRWYSTQDNAFTLTAFGKAARMATATHLTGTIRISGKDIDYTGGTQKYPIEKTGGKVTITLKGEGRLYYSLVTSGIRTDGKMRTGDSNLQVRREFLNRSGGPVDLSTIRQNDLIIVKLTVSSSVPDLAYVAVTDLLPAGFEIDNPRVTGNSNYSFVKNASHPEYMDIRDDRINIYTNFYSSKTQVFYYIVRAVTAGVYQYAPVVAEAMYNGDYYSANGKMVLRVNK
jgi:alpha-2-macroglobulin